MNNFVTRVGSLNCHFNPPCAPDQLNLLSDALGRPLDPTMRTFYTDHNGMARAGDFPIRLMSVEEVISMNEIFRRFAHPGHRTCAFWTDDNSNYIAVFIEGLMQGKVCFIDHGEGPLFIPQYRSLENFLEASLQAAARDQSWYDMPTDYPTFAPQPDTDAGDWELAKHFIGQFEAEKDEELRHFYAECAIKLLPYSNVDPLLHMANDSDMYVQESACELLGRRRIGAAIPTLGEVARTSRGNGVGAAILALGRIGGDDARQVLLDLSKTLPGGYKSHLGQALNNLNTHNPHN